MFFGKIFRTTILYIILLELLSFFGYLYPLFNTIVFLVLIVLFLIISLKHLDRGVYILLTELFIGSKGYLFYYDLDGTLISIRIAFWLIIMGVWFLKFFNKGAGLKPLEPFLKSKLYYPFFTLFIIIALSLLSGFVSSNGFGNIFNDFNAYLFFGLIFVFYYVINSVDHVKKITQIFAASLVTVSLKSIFLLYLFSHNFFGLTSVYKWVRTSGVGEITQMSINYYRIFFQSHIYMIIGFVMVLVFLLFSDYKFDFKTILKKFKQKKSSDLFFPFVSIAILSTTTILISLSRSFWLGLILGLIALFVFYVINERFSYKKFIINFAVIASLVFYILFIYSTKNYFGVIISLVVLFYVLIKLLKLSTQKIKIFTLIILIMFLFGKGLINNIVNFPIPDTGNKMLISIGDRAVTVSGEAAVGSRWNLIKPMFKEIMKFPTIFIGSGFGTTLTYKSTDPRILEKDPTGTYTTYAFEWGYLDFWLKFGIIGLAVYLFLLYKIFFFGWKQLEHNKFQVTSDNDKLLLGLLVGFVIILIVHGFTPYLNHPLGIGYILMCAVVFEIFYKHKKHQLIT